MSAEASATPAAPASSGGGHGGGGALSGNILLEAAQKSPFAMNTSD